MSLADELEKLQRLRAEGALSDDEFQAAKQKLLNAPGPDPGSYQTWSGSQLQDFAEHDDSLGNAANRYVTFRIVMQIIGLIVGLIVFMIVFSKMSTGFGGGPHFP